MAASVSLSATDAIPPALCAQQHRCANLFRFFFATPGKVAAYALLNTLVALGLLRPPSSLDLPTGTDETLALLLQMATVGGAVGAATVIVATQLHRNSNGSQRRENQGAVWAMLAVCGMLASTHLQQIFKVTLAFTNSETGLLVLPLQKMTKLSVQAITFTLMATACGAGTRLVWSIEIVVWVMNLTGFVLVFVERTSVYQPDFLGTSIFFAVLQVAVTGLLGRVSCTRVTVGPTSSHRPVALVAKVMIPIVIALMWSQTVAQVVLLYGVVADTVADITQTAVDGCMVIVLAQIISDKMWQQDDAARVAAAKQVAARATAEAAYAAQYTLLHYLFHELRVPLNGIMLAANDLSDTGTTPATQRENISTIVAGGDAMTKLLNDCVNLSKTQSGHLEMSNTRFAPRELIHSVLSLLQFNQLTVHVRVADDACGLVVGDERRLRQVLDNFATNAIRFTPPGGTIVFRACACPPGADPSDIVASITSDISTHALVGQSPVAATPMLPCRTGIPAGDVANDAVLPGYTRCASVGQQAHAEAQNPLAVVAQTSGERRTSVHAAPLSAVSYATLPSSPFLPQHSSHRASTSYVLFVVEDTGVGLTEGDQAKLFQPFAHIRAGATLKDNHTGLGLATAKFIVELGGGQIGCWSQPGEGSRFWFTVPCAPQVVEGGGSALSIDVTAPNSSGSVTTQPIMEAHSHADIIIHSAASSVGSVSQSCMSSSHLRSSTLGAGTTVSLAVYDATAPQVTTTHTEQSMPTATAQGQQQPMRMAVVVDDTDSNRLLLARLLQRMGAAEEVATAINGADALTHPEWLLADAWFVDRNMPVMDGMQLCRTLRTRGYRGPIIGVTGDGMLEDQAEFVLSGASLVVLKPCSKASLQQALNTLGVLSNTELPRSVSLQ